MAEVDVSNPGAVTREAPLAWSKRISYGAPSFAGAAMAIPIGIHLTIFYSDNILVPLGFIALVKALARALDAITDPMMGWISDRTRSPWGRRRPWMAVGAPLCAVAFYLMFTPPADISGVEAATWFAVTYTLHYLFHTVYIIPHYGLGPELTLDYNERSVLFGIREGFVVAGTLVAAVLPPVLIEQMGGEREGYTTFAILFGSLLAILYLNLVLRVKERPDFMARESNPLIPGIRRVMRNGVFRLLLVVYLVGSITGAIPGLMMPYFSKYVLQPENPDVWLAIYLATYFFAGFVSLPIWVWAARRFEKKPVWLAGFVPGFTGSLLLFTLGPGDLIPCIFILAWAGFGFSAGIFIGPAMQADVIDYDEFHTGKRREAQYGALWSIMTKFMVIPSMSIPLAILASVGYEPNVEQSDDVQFTIRAIFCLAPATTGIIAFLIAWFYPLTKARHEATWAGIEAHKRGEAFTDPITGLKVLPPQSRGVDEDLGWELDHFSLAELGVLQNKGARSLAWRIQVMVLLSLAVTIGSTVWLFNEVSLDTEPGLLAVLLVVAAGIGLTATVYHGVRWRTAARLSTPAAQDIERHVEITLSAKQGMRVA